ncbi:cytochrome P450 9e2-like [Phymastichus coffea]|uniref:cytochrome P450 9e2-like n=1 Tax=Phymastichus coffea TaxID=108790 RepID=UPI00273B2E3A|nr:cytochrome P450 9e2-like [Phymastichus coffea]
MDLTYLIYLFLIGAITYWYFKSIHSHWTKQNIPSVPDPLPIFGHMLPAIIMKENVSDFVQRAYNNFKASFVGFYFMHKPGIIVRDPDLVKCVLQTNYSSFRDNFVALSEKNDPLMARSPFFTNDVNTWKEGRNRISNHLSAKQLKYLFAVSEEVCNRMSTFMERKIQENGESYEVNLKNLFTRCTGELVANAAFAIEGQSFEDNPEDLSFTKVTKTLFESSFVKEILLFFFPSIAHFFGVSLLQTKTEEYMRQNIKSILEKRQRTGSAPNDYLQFTTELNANFDDILADVVNFYVDTYDTTSSAVANLFYNLSRNPDIQTKLRDHIMSVLKDANGQVTYESLKNMTYLEQVIHESMRMTPSLAFQPKRCTEEITLKGNDGLTCHLKPGDPILIPVVGIQHDEKYWPNPEIFDPDRFSPENRAKNNRYTFLAFGEGPRICVGIRLALMLVKQITASLIIRFVIEHSSKTKVPLEYEASPIFFGFKGGLWGRFKKLSLSSQESKL